MAAPMRCPRRCWSRGPDAGRGAGADTPPMPMMVAPAPVVVSQPAAPRRTTSPAQPRHRGLTGGGDCPSGGRRQNDRGGQALGLQPQLRHGPSSTPTSTRARSTQRSTPTGLRPHRRERGRLRIEAARTAAGLRASSPPPSSACPATCASWPLASAACARLHLASKRIDAFACLMARCPSCASSRLARVRLDVDFDNGSPVGDAGAARTRPPMVFCRASPAGRS
jgi:hypothetical protein